MCSSLAVMVSNRLHIVAGSLGMLQGTTCAVLALICIVLYNKKDKELVPDSYMDTVEATIYGFFLTKKYQITFPGKMLVPSVFTTFAWVYFFLHLLWEGASVYLIMSTAPKSTRPQRVWGLVTSLVTLWDLITVILLGADYTQCLNVAESFFPDDLSMVGFKCATGILPVLVITAKGFTLWTFNAILAVTLMNPWGLFWD